MIQFIFLGVLAASNSLINLDLMSYCQLGYTALSYNLYGCYCGIGGSGKPIDGIDE
ncbi:unnamed protein product [Dracunculus medinensis]|uniref:Phospholipase A2-like central domain-containing protein n=1 Tax=Dracunculus medinensis TaxID=318479 RepID=A0A3P7QH33_DRAME|nr:unnamed protein product [Dracunculus medinensis]